MAWIAGRVEGEEGGEEARCLREKRARKRCARGVDSVVRVLRRERIVGSMSAVSVGCQCGLGRFVSRGQSEHLEKAKLEREGYIPAGAKIADGAIFVFSF